MLSRLGIFHLLLSVDPAGVWGQGIMMPALEDSDAEEDSRVHL
jgi:hypothetical protein